MRPKRTNASPHAIGLLTVVAEKEAPAAEAKVKPKGVVEAPGQQALRYLERVQAEDAAVGVDDAAEQAVTKIADKEVTKTAEKEVKKPAKQPSKERLPRCAKELAEFVIPPGLNVSMQEAHSAVTQVSVKEKAAFYRIIPKHMFDKLADDNGTGRYAPIFKDAVTRANLNTRQNIIVYVCLL